MKVENFDQLPSYIEFVAKKLKMKDNYQAQCQPYMEEN
jgi:hypothetical protein